MPPARHNRESPLSLRLAEADLALIDRAAALRGHSRTRFMRDAAVKAAEDALMENTLIAMSAEGFADFMAALDRPTAPAPDVVEILQRPAPWEKPSS
jgi:uncharacterized protein (DUF1778 family)